MQMIMGKGQGVSVRAQVYMCVRVCVCVCEFVCSGVFVRVIPVSVLHKHMELGLTD